MNSLIRCAFHHFYTTFAWTYDAVAALVSLGEWKAWGRAALSQVPPNTRVLELAHGPGHLHLYMRQHDYDVVSVDLSAQMSHLLRARVRRAGLPLRQTQADVRALPFPNVVFGCVICTFPTEFIYAEPTLSEIERVLEPNGTLIVLPGVHLRGGDILARLIRMAFRVTGQMEPQTAPLQAKLAIRGWNLIEVLAPTRVADVVMWVAKRRSA